MTTPPPNPLDRIRQGQPGKISGGRDSPSVNHVSSISGKILPGDDRVSVRGVAKEKARRPLPDPDRFGCATSPKPLRVAARLLSLPVIGGLLFTGIQGFAQDASECAKPRDCAVITTDPIEGELFDRRFGENTERADRGGDPGEAGFSITIDGEKLTENGPVASVGERGKAPKAAKVGMSAAKKAAPVTRETMQRRADLELDRVDVQVKFDGLEVKPILNVATADLRRAYRAGDTVRFVATSNYPAWIARSEVLIYERGKTSKEKPLASVVVDAGGNAEWQVPAKGGRGGEAEGEYDYILRVYDAEGRFDETEPLTLARTQADLERHATSGEPVSPGNGEDRTALRNIPVHGGAVTVYGRNVPPGYAVRALGESIPVDNENSFVVQRILPPGDHDVDVAISGSKDNGIDIVRPINIPDNDFFYVGLADLTVGKRFASESIEAADPERYDGVYTKGRLAFYLKGKIKGKYLLTASADTGEDDVENLFKGLDDKDPRQLLRRIDPDQYYPVYGDDSTSVADAPTRGKFYVRIERGDSHVMWGNFKSEIKGNGLLRNERALYGASAVYKSPTTTTFGERIVEAHAYAAQAGTLPQRDIFRGTGGSVYFLKRQDVTRGSETVTVIVSDPVTGRILTRRTLRAGEDYDIDYIQGIIVLRQPLSSFSSDGGVVRDAPLGGNDVSLAVNYEYTPAAGEVDGYSYGGRVQAWVDNRVRVGVTGMSEETGLADQKMVGADLRIRHSETTYLDAEYAQTKGPGFGRTVSTDGGLTIIDEVTRGTAAKTGRAYKIKAQLDLSDIDPGLKGRIGGYFERKEAGFSTLDHDIDVNQRIWGVYAEYDISSALTFRMAHDDYEDAKGKVKRDTSADLTYQISEYWEAAFGLKYTDLLSPGGKPEDNGSRLDAGVRVTWTPNDDMSLYVFGQATVSRTGSIGKNDRLGVGGEYRLTEKISVSGEISDGTTGIGALAAINYDPTPDDRYYVGYKLDPARFEGRSQTLDGTDLGGVVFGSKRKFNDVLTGYAENNYDMFGRRRSLTTTYGVTYTPDALWTVTGGLELGTIEDPNDSDFERQAYSFGVSYKDEDRFTARFKSEVRLEESDDGTRDAESYLFSGGIAVKVSDDWRFIANADAIFSDSNSTRTTLLNGDFVEASVGFAYRPVENDRLNLLMKYTYISDEYGREQGAVSDQFALPMQRSHIFSIDGSYDVNEYLTLGAKYGFRIGEVSMPVGTGFGSWEDSSAHLGVVRADIHVINNWDILLEGRILHEPGIDSTDLGALVGVYRHFGKNVKVGVGYNFGSFSDDLSDVTKDDQGIFLNVIGKF